MPGAGDSHGTGGSIDRNPATLAPCELTILMPCLNEAETLGACIARARDFLEREGIDGEVLIADNGSDDGSREIATALGARVTRVDEKGYGAALSSGIRAARGRYVIMGDADSSYDFSRLENYVEKLRAGYALVMGNRFKGGILPGAMPPLHRYLGNPVLTALGRLFFKSPCGDFHCGLRGFNREAIQGLDLQTSGMEFASEMVVKATLHGLRIAEVPTTLSPDGRSRPPHLRTWRDGWRHLRFLLVYSPRWLFFYPGVAMMGAGLALLAWLLPGVRQIGPIVLDIHTLTYASGLVMIGLQASLFAAFTKIIGMNLKLLPPDPLFRRMVGIFTLERGLVVGLALVATGLVGSVYAVAQWKGAAFGPQQPQHLMRVVVPSVTALIAGMEIVFASFFMSVLQLARTPERAPTADDTRPR
ncbi:MAG: glycosyl transferase [Betaproteobacteria bacterium]|nr:glycosyl transferase [Betaproteobacteria bacterium]